MLVVDANLDMRYMYRGGSRILKGGGGLFIVVVSWPHPATPLFYCFLVLPSFENNRRTPLDPLVM